jgi:hypothetical protein
MSSAEVDIGPIGEPPFHWENCFRWVFRAQGAVDPSFSVAPLAERVTQGRWTCNV